MQNLGYTLLSDGSSDRALMPILKWLIDQHLEGKNVDGRWADLRMLPHPPKRLVDRITRAIERYPCDILFIHRDAERMDHAERAAEIHRALDEIRAMQRLPPSVCVVPVRMMEAWLLHDADAIRVVASNTHGSVRLDMPRLRDIENIPDPKARLYQLLRDAKGKVARRYHTNDPQSVHRVADLIEDFSPLRELSAFRALEAEVVAALELLALS